MRRGGGRGRGGSLREATERERPGEGRRFNEKPARSINDRRGMCAARADFRVVTRAGRGCTARVCTYNEPRLAANE